MSDLFCQDDVKALGVIIAGGKSRRFNAPARKPSAHSRPPTQSDKFLMPFGSSSLLGHIIDRAQKQVDRLVLNINGDPARLPAHITALGMEIISDEIKDIGPLGGILTAMKWAKKNEFSHIITFSGDSPFFPDDYAARLIEAVGTGDSKITICQSRGADGEIHRHPTMGIYKADLQEGLAAYIHGGGRRVMAWIVGQPHKEIVWDNISPDPFLNINRREDLAAAEKYL